MFAASANIYLRITVKMTTFAKNVGLLCRLMNNNINSCLKWFSIPFLGGSCPGFRCTLTCGCGQPSSAHQTLVSKVIKPNPVPWLKQYRVEALKTFSWQVETKSEREARGKPVGKDVPYAAMGGLTGFSSLIDGYLSLEINDSWEIHFKLYDAAVLSMPHSYICCIIKSDVPKTLIYKHRGESKVFLTEGWCLQVTSSTSTVPQRIRFLYQLRKSEPFHQLLYGNNPVCAAHAT